ncbi:MAG: hypothetical protein OHK0038_12100 [Flammeovirgaceae bacterium]
MLAAIPVFLYESSKNFKKNKFWFWLSSFIIFGNILYGLWAIIVTAPMFHAEKYRQLIGQVDDTGDFAQDIAAIDVEKIRIVDEQVAYRVGDKVLGAQPALGSQVNIGEFAIQKVGNDLFWVAPLLHSGFFKWMNNTKGTPGYVMVSAVNERDVRFIQEINQKPIFIKYQTGAYGFDKLQRHLYLNGYMTKGITDFTFEIDDELNPYWVVTVFEKTIGFAGEDATGVVIVNAQTGEIKEYNIDNAPKWVDRIQPEEFVSEQLDDWGEYVNGFFNISNEGKLETADEMSLVYGGDDKSYWYTGLTSVGADEGTVGFILTDTRTKKAKWYKQVGATEYAAQTSAMGKVQEKGYIASSPITYNINNTPTYVMSLKDQAGLIKMIAMVAVSDYTIVGVGNDLQEAIRAYRSALNASGNSVTSSSNAQRYAIKSRISRFSTDVNNGNTYYYLMLENYPHKIFVGTSVVSPELTLSSIGDYVNVFYEDGENQMVDMVSFDNENINPEKNEGKKEIEAFQEEVDATKKMEELQNKKNK